MSVFDLEALKREYAASDERGDAKFTIDFYDMTIVLERLEQAEQAVQRVWEVAAGWATNDRPFREALIRALDGDTRRCAECNGTGDVQVRFAHGVQAQDCASCFGSGDTRG